MKHIITKHQYGVGLIEVLIGLFILAFGLIALAVFSNRLFTDSADSKARLEAMQLAQEKLEQVRNEANRGDLASLLALAEVNPVELQGQNAVFNRTAIATDNDSTDYVVNWLVTVTWTDSKNNSPSIALTTDVLLSDLAALSALGEGSLGGGGNIDLPIGVAKYGEDGEKVEYTAADKDNGVAIVVDENTKTKYVVLADGSNDDGQVLVKIENYTSGNNSNDFAVINGSVYVNSDVGLTFSDHSFSAVTSLLLVRPSDVGICPWHMNDAGEVAFHSTDNELVKRLDYTCYVGAGWYGNITLVSPDGINLINTNNRTCGGDPDAYQAVDDSGLTSHRPQLLIARREYRGFKVAYNTDQITPLIDASGNRIYLPVGILGNDYYGKTDDPVSTRDSSDGYSGTEQRHDYYLADISLHDSEEAECNSGMETVYAVDNVFAGNSGSFVCLYGDSTREDIICPYVLPNTGETVAANPVTMTGNIKVEGNNATDILSKLSLETSQNESCELSASVVSDSWIEWSCTVYIPNVDVNQSGTWTGQVLLDADSSIDICGTSVFNIISATSDNIDYSGGYQFIVSDSVCSSSGLYTVSGFIENTAKNKTFDFNSDSRLEVDPNNTDLVNPCDYTPTTISSGEKIYFSCSVPPGFSGTISLITGIASANATALDFSGGNQVTGDVSGLIIPVK